MAAYDNIDFTPTDAMAAEAKRGLEWRKEFKRGGTAVGAGRASQLIRKEKLSPSVVKRMHSFFSRHEVDKKGQGFSKGEGYPSPGRIAWALWGGDAGQAWARKKVRQMNAADGKKTEAEFNQVIPMSYGMEKKRFSKAIEASAELLAQIERVTGSAVAASDIVIFEAAVANTRPLNKMGSIFNKGQITEDTLRQMASALNSGEESVPLHTLHMQGGELPIGKVFQAEVIASADGDAELRAMFFLPAFESALVERINLGIIDEVSVGVKSKALLCSKCGFDYFSAEAGFENLYSMTCESGHTVGDDGTHVKLSGLDKWMELSLVSRGAASKPKILGRTKQVLGRETYDRIAADGLPPEAVVLFTASDDKEAPMTTITVAFNPQAEIVALKAELAEIKTILLAEVVEPEEEDEDEVPVAPVVENSELDALKVELEAAKARIAELEAPAPEEEAAEEVTLDVSGIPVGGVSLSAVEDARKAPAQPSLMSFKTPKR